MNETDVSLDMLSSADELIEYLKNYGFSDEYSNHPYTFPELHKLFEKNSVVLRCSAKNKASLDIAFNMIFEHLESRLADLKILVAIFHVPSDYCIMGIAIMFQKVELMVDECMPVVYYQCSKDIFGVDFFFQ